MREGRGSKIVAARSRAVVVTALGTTQTLAWASSYYLPAILADPIAAGIHVPQSWVFGAFSLSLLIAAFAGPAVGRLIDRRGGRGVLVASNLVLAAGLTLLAAARGPVGLFSAWAVLGAGMALGLYDARFATLGGLYGHAARGPLTGITLFAGFASTVSWPLSSVLDGALGWRGACLVWAAINLAIALPINRFLLPFAPPPARDHQAGAGPHQAIAAAALVGPAQVAARLAEFALLRRIHPLVSARLAAALHPIGAA